MRQCLPFFLVYHKLKNRHCDSKSVIFTLNHYQKVTKCNQTTIKLEKYKKQITANCIMAAILNRHGLLKMLIDIKQVSKIAGIGLTSAYRLRDKGELPKAKKISPLKKGSLRWEKLEIEQWLDARLNQAA
jgi:predicted DNA-binding transcriptional regulator AlpA